MPSAPISPRFRILDGAGETWSVAVRPTMGSRRERQESGAPHTHLRWLRSTSPMKTLPTGVRRTTGNPLWVWSHNTLRRFTIVSCTTPSAHASVAKRPSGLFQLESDFRRIARARRAGGVELMRRRLCWEGLPYRMSEEPHAGGCGGHKTKLKALGREVQKHLALIVK
jgi:hypothetical protein